MKTSLISLVAVLASSFASASDGPRYTRLMNNSCAQPRWGLGIELAWTAWYLATDGVGMEFSASTTQGKFYVYRDGVLIASLENTGFYTDYDIVAGHTYSYVVTTDLGGMSWSQPMVRTCVESYEVTLNRESYTVSPDASSVPLGGVLTHYEYSYPNGPLGVSTSVPEVRHIDCDWIGTHNGMMDVAANTTGTNRTGHLWMSYSRGAETAAYDKIVSVTQLASGVAANGRNSYWDCYVAGLDASNSNDLFRTFISFENGQPIITWSPDLNEGGAKSERLYKVWGRETLDDSSAWEYPTNSLHRFFKVTVEMP